MTSAPYLSTLDADERGQLASRLMEEMRGKQALIDKLTHEMAILKRLKFAASVTAGVIPTLDQICVTIDNNWRESSKTN